MKKHMKKTASLLLAALLLCAALCSCGSGKKGAVTDAPETAADDPAKAIVGTWESKDFPDMGLVYVFNDDGTGTYAGEKIFWTIDGNKISISYEGTESFDTEFSINGDELNIIDSTGEDTIYIRK